MQQPEPLLFEHEPEKVGDLFLVFDEENGSIHVHTSLAGNYEQSVKTDWGFISQRPPPTAHRPPSQKGQGADLG